MGAKTGHQARIEEFMVLAGQDVPEKPTIPGEKVRILRARLIFEEMCELFDGLGVSVDIERDDQDRPTAKFRISKRFLDDANMREIADGCADLSIVTIGTLSACGIPDFELLRIVDENNLAKFGPGGYRDEHGKWIKPPGHRPPDIDGLLSRLRSEKPVKLKRKIPPWEIESRTRFHEYTGKKDCDGTDIFEGDVLKMTTRDDRDIFELVCWSPNFGAWIGWRRLYGEAWHHSPNASHFSKYRRIGSYDDDPKLLKVSSTPPQHK